MLVPEYQIDALTNDVVARYVVQLTLVKKAKRANVLGSFCVWKKGGLFGVSDESLGFCPAQGCLGVISSRPTLLPEEIDQIKSQFNSPEKWPPEIRKKALDQYGGTVLCPVCASPGKRGELPDGYVFNMVPSKIAARAEQLFNQLNMDADFELVRAKQPDGLQQANEYLATSGRSLARYSDKLDAARERDIVFYSLASVLKDVSAGSTVASRIKALIEA